MSGENNRMFGRREMLKSGLAGAAGLAGARVFGKNSASAAVPGRRPNIIIFHTDDQDFNTLSCYGYDVLTPHADALASSGICFERGYTTTGVCTASRYALVTGMYPSRCLSRSFKDQYAGKIAEPSFNTRFDGGEHTIASVMKSAGYATGFVGKWDLGGFNFKRKQYPRSEFWAAAWRADSDDADPSDPEISAILERDHENMQKTIKSFGFDYAEAITNNPESWANRALNYHNPEWITDRALKFISEKRDNPFFLYMNHTLHHIPHPQESLLTGDPRMTQGGYLDRVPDCMPPRREIFERVKKEGYRPETAYCTWMDESLGAVLKRLGELGISDDTLIIFFSDNNVPAKATIYEDGVRVPAIARYPRMIRGGQRSQALLQNIDFAPTAFELAGEKAPSDMHLDGRSLVPLLDGSAERVHDELFFEIGWSRAVCTERWKYLALRQTEEALEERKKKGGFLYHGRALTPHQHNALLWHPSFLEPDQLYDLPNDPHEVVNFSHTPEFAPVLDDMKGRLGGWLRTFDYPFAEFTG